LKTVKRPRGNQTRVLRRAFGHSAEKLYLEPASERLSPNGNDIFIGTPRQRNEEAPQGVDTDECSP
jgi:hypothetical protein